RDRGSPQQGNQRGPRRSQDHGAARRHGRDGARRRARRFRQAHRRRDRKVGQGDQGRGHQAAVTHGLGSVLVVRGANLARQRYVSRSTHTTLAVESFPATSFVSPTWVVLILGLTKELRY